MQPSPGLHLSGQDSSLVHFQTSGRNIAIELRVRFQLAPLRTNRSLHSPEQLHLSGLNVSLDPGVFADRQRPLIGLYLPIHFPIDDHVVLKLNRPGDLNPLCEDILRAGHGSKLAS